MFAQNWYQKFARVFESKVNKVVGLFTLALVLRVVFVLLVPYTPWFDAKWYDDVAWRLAQGFGYSLATGEPTAYVPPFYSLVLATIYMVFGHSLLAGRLLNAVLDSFTAVLLYQLVVEFHRGTGKPYVRLAVISGILYAVNPITMFMSGVTMTEIVFTTLLVAILLFAVRVRRKRNQSVEENQSTQDAVLGQERVWYAIVGVLGGLAALTRSAVVPVWAFIICESVAPQRVLGRVYKVLIATTFFVLTISPWVARNWRISGQIVFDNHAGWGMYAGTKYEGTLSGRHVNVDVPISSEWELIKVGRQELLNYVKERPVEYLWYSLRRAGHMLDLNLEAFMASFASVTYGSEYSRFSEFLRSKPAMIPVALLPILQSILWISGGLIGLYSWFDLPGRNTILTIVLLWVVSHAAFTGFPRYFMPMLPLLTIPLAHAILYVREHQPLSSRSSAPLRWKGTLSNITITLMLILALGTWLTTVGALSTRLV